MTLASLLPSDLSRQRAGIKPRLLGHLSDSPRTPRLCSDSKQLSAGLSVSVALASIHSGTDIVSPVAGYPDFCEILFEQAWGGIEKRRKRNSTFASALVRIRKNILLLQDTLLPSAGRLVWYCTNLR